MKGKDIYEVFKGFRLSDIDWKIIKTCWDENLDCCLSELRIINGKIKVLDGNKKLPLKDCVSYNTYKKVKLWRIY